MRYVVYGLDMRRNNKVAMFLLARVRSYPNKTRLIRLMLAMLPQQAE